ncbi:SRPBCC family protein [Geodermatophilus pulveris]|uniref:SRPBCC family protein n=1 Tax=Geodermatophilus pulveris TaxID=1564159 RepID=UPI000B78A89D|nr:SRPBCC family protein [Geodermatophilus pulveris]
MTPDLTFSDSIVVAASPEEVYDLVSDVTRTGEWSPVCRACWWDDGDGPRVGARFTGRNETPDRTWETRSQVVAADRGRQFAWVVGESLVRWAFRMEPAEGGTRLTESWEFLPAGLARFAERYGDDAERQVADRTRAAHEGIPATLAAIARIAGSGPGHPGQSDVP